ncbi:P-loop containing nucleoside triphosphate hydrolase [Pseudocohnilembus persalinus]|uniref:p-loop containing nucleoside triphosphate hydrolase n=1 Tax=Pseudocohnilembus persalinus TaxID=266149 RepID=A0A0V0Q9S8_PSEPJ|nr:P-loop containing nucleoside triphosphate hydrolase [Pseudocohnilembus persalinus]|eukprot:KRW98928.1 P-loop containing nucleoside triphosphate hydrolase [Pseudocohnilembus persalinus]
MNAKQIIRVDIPHLKLVFMGEQSVGKSTALTHLMGKENIVPIKSGLGTKLATKVVFKQSGSQEVTIYLEGQQEQKKEVFQKNQYREISQKIIELNDSQNGEISDQAVIVIEYGGQDYNLEFYDLPGLRNDPKYKQATEKISQKYLQDKNTVVLFCNATDSNSSNAHPFFQSLVKERPQDVLVVLTKIDKGDTNTQNALQFLQMQDEEENPIAGYIIIAPRKNEVNDYADQSKEVFEEKEKEIQEKEYSRTEEQRIQDLKEAEAAEIDLLKKKEGLKEYSHYLGKYQGLKQIYQIQFRKIEESKILQNCQLLIQQQLTEQRKKLQETQEAYYIMQMTEDEYMEQQKDRNRLYLEGEFQGSYFNLILGSEFQSKLSEYFDNFLEFLYTIENESILILSMLRCKVSQFQYYDKNQIINWLLQKRKKQFLNFFEALLQKIKRRYEHHFKQQLEDYKFDYYKENDIILQKYVESIFGKIENSFNFIIDNLFELDYIQQIVSTEQHFIKQENQNCQEIYKPSEKDILLKKCQNNNTVQPKTFGLFSNSSNLYSSQQQSQNPFNQSLNMAIKNLEVQQNLGDYFDLCLCQVQMENKFKVTFNQTKLCKLHYQNGLLRKNSKIADSLFLDTYSFNGEKKKQIQDTIFDGLNIFQWRDNLQIVINNEFGKNRDFDPQNFVQPTAIEEKEIDEIMIKSYLFLKQELQHVKQNISKIIHKNTKNFTKDLIKFVYSHDSEIWKQICDMKKLKKQEGEQHLIKLREKQQEFIEAGERALFILEEQEQFFQKIKSFQ